MISASEWELITDRVDWYRKERINTQYCKLLCDFLVTAEDHRFWSHPGVDLISLVRAIWKTKMHKKREGGSTVAMQLVRTITGDYNLSAKRKIKEIYYAFKISLLLEKQEVLNIYLSIAYFGWNMHGIEQACNRLGYDIENLTRFEAASLIARLKYPEPKNNSKVKRDLIKYRADHIIKRHTKLKVKTLYGKVFSPKRIKADYLHISRG